MRGEQGLSQDHHKVREREQWVVEKKLMRDNQMTLAFQHVTRGWCPIDWYRKCWGRSRWRWQERKKGGACGSFWPQGALPYAVWSCWSWEG